MSFALPSSRYDLQFYNRDALAIRTSYSHHHVSPLLLQAGHGVKEASKLRGVSLLRMHHSRAERFHIQIKFQIYLQTLKAELECTPFR